MAKENKSGVKVPNLRFPGFEGEWKEKMLGDVAPLQRGFDLPVDKMKEGLYPVVFSNGILKFHNAFKVKGPGVVTGRSGTIGKVNFVDNDYWPHNTSLWVTDFKGNIPKYIFYFYSKYNLERFGTGSGVPTLNRNNVHIQKEYFPLPVEQEKIAAFLSVLDQRITTQNKIIENLQTLIKSITKKIFNQEIRFKDNNGSDYPDWEIKNIGDVLKIGSGKDYKHLGKGNIPVFGTGGLMTHIDSFLYNGETVCIGRKGTINKPMYYNGKIWTVDTLFYTHSFQSCTPKFIFHLFQTINWLEYNEASGVPSLSKATIEKISIEIPSIEEQNQIATFLFKIDQKIQTEKAILNQLEMQKKYLLQQIFI